MKNRGFTLIELCVVIAIVLIVAALLVGQRYEDVCLSGVTYIRNTHCSKCPLVVKVDAQTLQPARCPTEKVP